MHPIERELARAFMAVPAAVTTARHTVLAFARRVGAPTLTCENVALAVSEAVTNAVLHSYLDGDDPSELQLRASVTNDELRVIIADNGRGMQPRSDSPGLGIGLDMIKRVSHRFEVRERDGGGAELHMIFALAPAHA